MKRVWKYPLDKGQLRMPKGAEILSIQFDQPVLWALVDPAEELEKRDIVCYGTGQPHPDKNKEEYLGTFQIHQGKTVIHVFEVKK